MIRYQKGNLYELIQRTTFARTTKRTNLQKQHQQRNLQKCTTKYTESYSKTKSSGINAKMGIYNSKSQ